MKAAIIENSKVTNVAIVSDVSFAQSQGWIVSETAKIGDSYDAETGEFTTPEPAPEPVILDVLKVDKWTLQADAVDEVTATYTTESTAYFVVDGELFEVEPVGSVATLEISANAPGPIQVQARDKQLVITALEVV